MYLLDTNIVSELRRPSAHGELVGWIASVPASQLFVSAVTISEIQTGIERARSTAPDKAAELDRWLDALAAAPNVLPMNADTFRLWAKLTHRQPATAKLWDLTVVSRNLRDFLALDVAVLDPVA